MYNPTEIGATVYTDNATAYKGMIGREHETAKPSVGEWVNGMAHTSGLASFWATLKRAYHGVYHKMIAKHLQRYVQQFAQKHNVRDMDTLEQMQHVVSARAGRRLMYKDLIAQ